jgi:thiol-disulfide isomerase/thioredoxin
MKTPEAAGGRRPGLTIAVVALAGVLVGLWAIYGIGPSSRNGEGACPGSADLARRLEPLARGEVAALNVAKAPAPLLPLTFAKADGSPVSLATFKGRTILLNLWATWCAPCRREMPALDRLQALLGGPDFEVVAVNIDTRNPERANALLDEIKVATLTRYQDPSAKIFQDLKEASLAVGMPTTLLVDPQGCLIASLSGPADWASQDGEALLQTALQASPGPGGGQGAPSPRSPDQGRSEGVE